MKDRSKLTVRDLVLIGVLTVLLAVVSMGVGMLTMPLLSFALIAGSALSAMVSAPIYLLMAFKVGKRGVMLIYALLLGTCGYADGLSAHVHRARAHGPAGRTGDDAALDLSRHPA
jgi:hypothetical protein